jgi:hypothetical protein
VAQVVENLPSKHEALEFKPPYHKYMGYLGQATLL